MSSFTLKAKNRKTRKVITFTAIDDYFGRHRFGYKDEEGIIYDEDAFNYRFNVIKGEDYKTK